MARFVKMTFSSGLLNQIMIDRDLAELYGVETKRLNEAVKRNNKKTILLAQFL